jgi:hypothetical protein
MKLTSSLRSLACVVLCALPGWGLADAMRVPTTFPLNNTVRMSTTTVPMVPPPAATMPVPMPPPAPAGQQTAPLRVEEGQKMLYAGTTEQQLARLQRKVEILEQRLAQAEKHITTHRHAYQTHGINYMSAESFESLLWRAKNRPETDRLIGLPGGTLHRETGPGLVD